MDRGPRQGLVGTSVDRRMAMEVKEMNSVDQIKPFAPAQRVQPRPQDKVREDKARKGPADERARRKRGPRGGHRVDELA